MENSYSLNSSTVVELLHLCQAATQLGCNALVAAEKQSTAACFISLISFLGIVVEL